jgi:hypothetical protein
MSTINASISLNSTTTFPSVNLTTQKKFDSDKSTFGTIKVSSEIVPLSFDDCGTQGAYIYAKAPLSNPDGVGVELSGVEQIFGSGDSSSFATLYPGDIALIPLSPTQLSLIATTTTGEECTLEYSYSSRGVNFGENLITLNPESGAWTLNVLDANYGKAHSYINSGISSSTFGDIWDSYYIQDKGYVFVFKRTGLSIEYRALMIDTHGNPYTTSIFSDYNIFTVNSDEQISSSIVIQYYNGSNWNNFFVFDGQSFINQNFDEYSDNSIVFDDAYNNIFSDGSFLVYGQRAGATSINDVLIVNRDKKYKIYSYNSNIESNPYITSATQNSNAAIILGRSIYNEVISITIADTQGNILHDSPFNVDLHNTHLYIDTIRPYGNGKFLIILSDLQYRYFIHYDSNTNILIGGDLSWKYLKSYYPYYTIYSSGTNTYGEDSAFHEDSIMVELYINITYGFVQNDYHYPSSGSFAITYVIPGMKEPGFYEFWNGSVGNKPYIYETAVEKCGTKNRIAIVYTDNPTSGNIYQLTLTPTQQIVDTISSVNEYNYFSFCHFTDDYSFYRFSGNIGSTNEKYIVHKLGTGKTNNIVDTLTLPLNHQSFSYTAYYTDYGLLLISHLDTGKLYYFNSNTNKFTLFATSIGFSDVIYNHGISSAFRNKQNSSYVPGDISGLGNVLLDTDTGLAYYFYNNNFIASTALPGPNGNWYVEIGNGTYVFIYYNGTSYIVNVYNLSDLKLIRSIDTGYNNTNYTPKNNYSHQYGGICNNRIFIIADTEFGPKLKMISSTGAIQEINYEDNYYVNDVIPYNY